MPSPYSEFVFPDLGFVRWWSVFLTLGILLGAWVAARDARRTGLDSRHVLPLLVVMVPLGVIGARAYYVIFEWERRFADVPELIPQIWQGGVALHGALLGGALGLWIYARLARIGFLRWGDAIALGLPLGMAVARWGDYFNQQSFGDPTDLPWGIQIDSFYRPLLFLESELNFHPTFFYEFLWDLLVLALVLIASRRFKGIRPGERILLSLGAYSVGRFFIEALRADAIIVGDGVRLAMIVSAAMAGLSVAVFLLGRWRPAFRPRRRSASPPSRSAA